MQNMKSFLFLQTLGAGEVIIIAFVLIFFYIILICLNARNNGREFRKSNDRVIFGICGGIAEYLDVSSFLVRFVFVCSGVGIGLYLFLAIVMRD